MLSVLNSWYSPWREYIAEFIGTFLFVFITLAVVLSNILYTDIGTVGVAVSIGFSYAALVYATAHLSGGFLNPAIVVALWLAQKVSFFKAIFFIFFQISAGFAAALLVNFVFGAGSVQLHLGAPEIGSAVSVSSALILEAIFTGALVFTVFSTMVDRSGSVSFGPLVLGLLLTAVTLAALPISGSGFNPARVIGPYVISADVSNLAVWIIGPLVGSLFSLKYEILFLRKKFKK